MRPLLAFLFASSTLVACGGAGGTRNPAGPNYSSTPCVDNCGNDAQCQASCQDVNNQQPLPGGAQPSK